LGSLKLEIESGIFHNILRENSLCQQGVVESEFHFLLCCNHYQTLSDKYFGNMAWPTINTFDNITSCKIKSKLIYKIYKRSYAKIPYKYNCFTLCCGYISLCILMSFLFLFVPACVLFVFFCIVFLVVFIFFRLMYICHNIIYLCSSFKPVI